MAGSHTRAAGTRRTVSHAAQWRLGHRSVISSLATVHATSQKTTTSQKRRPMARSARCSIPHPKRARALEARAFGRHEIVAALEPDQRQLGIELHREPRAARKQGTNTRRLAEHAGEA